MPNRWTFEIKPIREFVERWISEFEDPVIVDPFAGKSEYGTYRNDLADGGVDAREFGIRLLEEGIEADIVLFDPPYSPRQISECYKNVGLKVGMKDTQSGVLYKEAREPMRAILKPGGIALSFGWSSSGFGKAWPIEEVLLVQHGGAHNDTICVAQRKPNEYI